MKKTLAILLTLALLLGLAGTTVAVADDDWITLRVETAQNLSIRKMVALMGTTEPCKKRCCYKDNFLALIQKFRSFVQNCCVNYCLFVF